MRVLVLTFYFSPDLCAGSFRATPFVEALRRQLGTAGFVDVVTTLPNRYSSFSVEAPSEEVTPGLRVRRIAMPAHQSGVRDQARSFSVFAREALRLTRGESYDVVFATSSRLMTASLGAWIARRAGAPLYLDLRDIFTDTIADLFDKSPIRFAVPPLQVLERWTIRRARAINLVSEGFGPYFEALDSPKEYRFVTNGIDEEFLGRDFSGGSHSAPYEVLYAGNIGEGQGLHRIVPGLASALEGKFRFTVIGDGGARKKLEAAVAAVGVTSVQILDPMTRSRLLDAYRQADVLFVHLNDQAALHKVLPSKIFEYASTGKPILAGLGGYSARFARERVERCAVFDPCDVPGAVDALTSLELGPVDRKSFVDANRRSVLMDRLATDVISVASNSTSVAGARS